MTYTKYPWTAGKTTPINATNLNHIEEGIYDAHEMATGRGATLVVAANDSSTLAKQQADAVCDGVADNVEIQAAINVLPANGGTVRLMEGTYSVSSSISLAQNVCLEGIGAYHVPGATLMNLDSNVNMFTLNSTSYVIFKNIYFDMKGRDGYNIINAETSHGVEFYFCAFNGLNGVDKAGPAIYINASYHWKFMFCKITNCGSATNPAIHIRSGDAVLPAPYSSDIEFIECCFEPCKGKQIYLEDTGLTSDFCDVKFSHCKMECHGTDYQQFITGDARRIHLIDCALYGTKSDGGIELGTDSDHVSIVACDFVSPQGHSIVYDSKHGRMFGNSFENSQFGNERILLDSNSENCLVANNTNELGYNFVTDNGTGNIGRDNEFSESSPPRSCENLIENGDFEVSTIPLGWDYIHVTATRDSDHVINSNCLKIVSDGTDAWSRTSQVIPDPTRYRSKYVAMSCYAKADVANTATQTLQLIDSVSEEAVTLAKDGAWHRITLEKVIDASATWIELRLLPAFNSLTSGETVRMDAAVVIEGRISDLPIYMSRLASADRADSGVINHSETFMDVLAVSATHVRSNEDLSAATPITFTIDAQPDVPRTLSWAFDSHAQITEYDMEVIGVDAKGNAATETWDETAGWSGETSNAFATITSIKMTSRTGTGAADTMDIGITDVIGMSNVIYATGDVFKIKKNNADATVAGAQVNTTYVTYDMSVIGLGVGDDFTIWYKSNLNIIS